MRAFLNSTWTPLSLLLAGAYLLAFAGVAWAIDPPGGPPIRVVDSSSCEPEGTPANPKSCTHYTTTDCIDKLNDPNVAGVCGTARWIKVHHIYLYGLCKPRTNTSSQCSITNPTCAVLKFWTQLQDCADNVMYKPNEPCWLYVYLVDSCVP